MEQIGDRDVDHDGQKEKLIDLDPIQNLFWVSITLYKRCVLRICRSEQAIHI